MASVGLHNHAVEPRGLAHLVPAALAGEAMTAFMAVLLSTLAAGAVAWLVPDRPNLA